MLRFKALVVAGLLCAVTWSNACALSTYCVDTAAGLDAALAQTQSDDVRVNLVQGSYDMRATRLDAIGFDIEGALTLVGGYSAGCNSRSYDASLTTLYADASTDLQIGYGGDIVVSALTFRDFHLFGLAATDLFAEITAEHDLRLDRVAFRDGFGVIVEATHAYVKQVAVTGMDFSCALRVEPDGLDLVQVENSLFANNAGEGLCIKHYTTQIQGWGNATIYNSIFWDNGSADIEVTTTEDHSDILLKNNIYQSTSIVPSPTTSPSGTLNADPKFVNAAAGDYHIANNSPARDSGTSSIPGGVPTTDLQGLQRLVGSAIDRGPYENQSAGLQFIYAVTNTNDSGAGSLRQALLDAESTAGLNGITFNIAGAGCPKVIIVPDKNNPLPVITQSLVIDGLSQPGSSGNNLEDGFNATLCVLLKAGSDVTKGLVVDDSAATSAAVSIKGLGFTGFTTAAIDLRGGSGHYIGGNQFSSSMGANTLDNGSYAIRVTRLDPPAISDVQIGGDDPNQRNLIGNADTFGIVLNGDEVRDTQVVNNFIGFHTGEFNNLPVVASDPNLYGIVSLGAIDTTIRDNWISGNTVDGVFLNGSNAYVTGNHIGIAPVNAFLTGDVLGNGGWGVRVNYGGAGSSNNVIGSGVAYFLGLPTPVGQGNTIAYNGAGGIRADGGLGHRFSRNLLHDNGRPEIDIAASGFTFNNNDGDPAASDLSNRGLNYPLWSGLQGGGHLQATLHASLASTNGTYRIEVYSSPACYGSGLSAGEARFYHGATAVIIDNEPPGQNGSVAFDYKLKAAPGATPLDGRGIVMLAIDADGNTSELSLCAAYQYSDVIFADDFQ